MTRVLIAALLMWASPTTDQRAEEVRKIGQAIEAAAELSGRDSWTLAAIAVKESSLRNDVVGRRGECGLGQVQGRYLRPRMRCHELQTAEGGALGMVRALEQWESWLEHNPARGDEWHCYASGNRCYAPIATLRLRRLEVKLRAFAAGYLAAAVLFGFAGDLEVDI